MRSRPTAKPRSAAKPDHEASIPTSDREFDFETFARSRPRSFLPFLTLEAKQRISVSAGAALVFGTPDAVELRFDRVRKVVAIRPADLATPDAYKVMRRGTKQKVSGFTISAIAFCHHYGIETPASTRYPVEMFEGMLISDLNSPL